jgi:subtilisin family serine protease
LNSSNFGSATGILNAVQEAVDFSAVRPNPAVLNFSIVGDSAGVNAALDSAIDAGIVVVICAGNDGLDLGTIDGGFAEEIPDSIVVGGLEWRDGPYYIFPAATGSFPGISCTRYGSRVDVSAPSQWVKGATNTGDSNYIPLFGTSFGCAFTSGVVACLLQGQTKPTTRAQVQAVRTYIQNSAQADVQNASHTPVQLPNRRLYLDPTLTPPVTIPGL